MGSVGVDPDAARVDAVEHVASGMVSPFKDDDFSPGIGKEAGNRCPGESRTDDKVVNLSWHLLPQTVKRTWSMHGA